MVQEYCAFMKPDDTAPCSQETTIVVGLLI
jgi:hypothetical protein